MIELVSENFSRRNRIKEMMHASVKLYQGMTFLVHVIGA